MLTQKLSRRSFLALSAATAAQFALDGKKLKAYAAKVGPKEDHPVVIIGAGLGGLCCAAYLAREGFPVTVVEKRDIPGGYASAFDRADGKFTFDVSLHGMAASNNAAARILADLGALEKVQLVPLPEIYLLQTGGESMSIPQKDPEAYIEMLAKYFPKEKHGIRRLVQEVIVTADEADTLHQKGMCAELLFPFKYPHLTKVLKVTLDDLMAANIKEPALKNILASWWDFHGLPPSKVSGMYYAVAKGDALKNGTYYVRERSQDLSNALADAIERSGGQIMYDTAVESIRVRQNSVEGVAVSGGKVLPARTVVSNANVLDTFENLVARDAVPSEYLKRIKTHRPSLSSFIVWLGLNQELQTPIKACGIHVMSDVGTEADYQACLQGDVERIPIRISLYDNMYPGYSQKGSSTVRVFCLAGYEPWRRFEVDYRAGHKEEYYRQKDRWARVLIRRAEEIIPGISGMIEVQDAATPLTNWRFTGNTEGAVYGFEQSVDNAYVKRISNRTPVKGLFLAGAWCNPGGGFGGALLSGQFAFQSILDYCVV
jgi:prolycopene isomerase